MAWVGELRDLPAHVVVECVTASALNAAIRAGKAADTDVERERLRVAEGAPSAAGTDFTHAARGLLALYKLKSVEAHSWVQIPAAVTAGKSVLIRVEYCSFAPAYRFQTACAFSHCLLVIPSKVSGCGLVIDPLDYRGAGARPIGKDIPWAFIKTACASDGNDALIVEWTPPAPVPAPATKVDKRVVLIALISAFVIPAALATNKTSPADSGTNPQRSSGAVAAQSESETPRGLISGRWGQMLTRPRGGDGGF